MTSQRSAGSPGATGQVYLAEDSVLVRPVAIQFIADPDPAARQRFLTEAWAAAWRLTSSRRASSSR